jgi:hypothetical protein
LCQVGGNPPVQLSVGGPAHWDSEWKGGVLSACLGGPSGQGLASFQVQLLREDWCCFLGLLFVSVFVFLCFGFCVFFVFVFVVVCFVSCGFVNTLTLRLVFVIALYHFV